MALVQFLSQLEDPQVGFRVRQKRSETLDAACCESNSGSGVIPYKDCYSWNPTLNHWVKQVIVAVAIDSSTAGADDKNSTTNGKAGTILGATQGDQMPTTPYQVDPHRRERHLKKTLHEVTYWKCGHRGHNLFLRTAIPSKTREMDNLQREEPNMRGS